MSHGRQTAQIHIVKGRQHWKSKPKPHSTLNCETNNIIKIVYLIRILLITRVRLPLSVDKDDNHPCVSMWNQIVYTRWVLDFNISACLPACLSVWLSVYVLMSFNSIQCIAKTEKENVLNIESTAAAASALASASVWC